MTISIAVVIFSFLVALVGLLYEGRSQSGNSLEKGGLESDCGIELHSLRVPGMVEALEQQLEQLGTDQGLSFEQRLNLMIDRELTYRSGLRIAKGAIRIEIQWSIVVAEIHHSYSPL